MEIIQFDIVGKCAHFRKYYTNNTAFTYSLPPRTTIMGILAAIAGMERDSYYEALASDKIDIGIAVRSPIKKSFHRLNFLSIKSVGDIRKSFDSDFRGMAGNPIQTPFEIVTGHHMGKDSICYRVFLGRREAGKDIFDSLKEKLLMRDFVYAPTLGVASFQASITAPVIYTSEQVVEKQADNEYLSFDSAVASENVTDLLFEKEGNAFVEEELLPADFTANYNREMSKMSRVLFTTAGIPLKVRLTGNYFVMQGDTTIQTIQFLDRMTAYSHSRKLPDGRIIGVKTMREHWTNVFDIAQLALEKRTGFSLSFDEIRLLLEDISRYHDLGKYTRYFQRYLLTSDVVDRHLRSHARFGAYAIFVKYQHKDPVIAAFLYFIILHHHRDLNDIRDNEFDRASEEEENYERFLKQKDTISGAIDIIQQELREQRLGEYISCPDSKIFYHAVKKVVNRQDIRNYFLVNYLFSLLIEADKLDASETPFYMLRPLAADLVGRYRPVNINELVDVPVLSCASQNQLRSYCRLQVNQYLLREDWYSFRLFTLTAPTGIGKTLTALDFALKLRALLREKEGREARIIYALPFINIIEQAYKAYTEVFDGSSMKLLAHYQYADVLEQAFDEEKQGYSRKTMQMETWQCDVVITTFVQFFQTLIGNRNKLLKKFSHLAGAIIILDEVQTIRLGQLPLIGAALYYLSKFLDARIVLMTATKPKIFELANQEILKAAGEEARPVELLPDNASVFSCFNRTKIVSLLAQPVKDEQMFLDTIFFQKWKPDNSCLIVCNTVSRSVDLYKTLSAAIDTAENPVYYLSTNIIPLHRKKVIEDVSRDIAAGNKPILIATQCVEAGVDLDFDMGFRDLGPIDSIIQVAGRINRNNHPEKKYSPLYIIDFEDCSRIYDPITRQQAEKALGRKPEVPEEAYLSLVDDYFSNIAESMSFEESRKIFEAMQLLKYASKNNTGVDVSSFRIIEERSATLSVFIELDEYASELKDYFIQLIHKKMSEEDFAPYKRAFYQHIISVPGHLPKAMDLQKSKNSVLCEGVYVVNSAQLADFYDVCTGFDRSKESKDHSMFL